MNIYTANGVKKGRQSAILRSNDIKKTRAATRVFFACCGEYLTTERLYIKALFEVGLLEFYRKLAMSSKDLRPMAGTVDPTAGNPVTRII